MSTNTKLAEALAQFEAALLFAYPAGARGAAFDCWNKARQALAAHDAEQALPLKDRPDFIAGYDAGLKDGRACERRDAAEQAAQAVPAGFKWVPVEPTEDMLTAAGREDDKAFVDGMPHGATAADVWAPSPSPPPDTEAVTACWQDFGRTEEFRRAVKWSQDGEIPGALFVAFRAGLRAASPKALCDCGKKAVADCDKWEPGCDLGQSPEHARVVEIDLKPEQAQQSERERFEDVARSLGFQRDELNRSNLSLVRKDYRNHATEECWKFWQAARADILARLEAVPCEAQAVQDRPASSGAADHRRQQRGGAEVNNRKDNAKPDPREKLTWWPNGFCSAWNQRKKKCHRGGECMCLKPRAHGQGAATGEQQHG